MRPMFLVLPLLFSMTVKAQDLPDKPHLQGYRSLTVARYAQIGFMRQAIDPSTPIPEDMVWHAEDNWWVARKIGSCDLCGRPMTFKQAALDRMAIEMWGLALALGTANVVVAATRPCVQQLTCRSGFVRPTMGRTVAFEAPSFVALWMGTAWARKGNLKYHRGGYKYWWILPMMHQAVSASFMGATLARF